MSPDGKKPKGTGKKPRKKTPVAGSPEARDSSPAVEAAPDAGVPEPVPAASTIAIRDSEPVLSAVTAPVRVPTDAPSSSAAEPTPSAAPSPAGPPPPPPAAVVAPPPPPPEPPAPPVVEASARRTETVDDREGDRARRPSDGIPPRIGEPEEGADVMNPLAGAAPSPRRVRADETQKIDYSGDFWPLDTREADTHKPAEPAPPSEPPPAHGLPDPKAAALEAARIVGEIVGDIESAGGAAIVAAAAAGAAIEAARARRAAGVEPEPVQPASTEPVGDPASSDPVVTVRMQRDRILRALAEDIAAQAEAKAAAPATPAPTSEAPPPSEKPAERASSASIGARATSQDGTADDGADEEFDPVQIAAAAISRLRNRAKTDLAELRGHYQRLDIVVLLAAFVIIVVAGRIHRRLTTPPTVRFAERGLVFEHSKAWLAPEPVPAPTPRIIHELSGQPSKSPDSLYHVEFTSSIDPNAKLEVSIDKKPAWSNIVTGLELDRRTRWGELYKLQDSAVRSIAGHDWLRTSYLYAHAAEKGDLPRVDEAIEYATIDRDQIYVITLFGTAAELGRIEDVVAPSLRVASQTGLPLVPQTRTLAQRTYPNAIVRAFDSTVMVVAADLVDGRLKPRGGGSGVIVGSDGSILTNYHVIHDKDGRLHDVFVIGRFGEADHAPQLWCAGRPSRSKLQRDFDLALIKCDLDLDGRAWNPTSSGVWPVLPSARTADVHMGQRLWVLGFPDVGGGGLTLSEGEVEGFTGENGAAEVAPGQEFIKTDASITHGNSGGPVVDDQGRLVGIASAFRTRVSSTGAVTETSQVGLVRPLSAASDLLAIAVAGWTPREGHTDVELQPSAVEAPAEGVRISTKVLDASNETPVRDALVMILRPGVSSSAVDVNRLDDQVLAWGRSNTLGEVQLKQPVPVPGTYSVMVVARGYEPLIGEGELHLDANTPPAFDPWGKIWLRSR